MNIKNRQKGFTLIELMIVIAIIGILAAIAIPSYMNYTVRAKVSEGLALSAANKTAVAVYYHENGSFPSSIADARTESASGTNVASTGISGLGVITITYSNDSTITGNSVLLTPTATAGSISWACTSTNIAAKYLPSTCTSSAT
ncbi:pilin [Francisellaceae bacterium]|nr:pilin [Francisellaceae bacterium]